MTTAPIDVALAYHRAWTTNAIDRAMSLVADDIQCHAPGVELDGKEQYRAFIEGFAPALTGIGDIAQMVDGDRVLLMYYPETSVTATAPAAELFTVRGGLIVSSVLIFDRLAFAPADQA
jgi:hypothetical protein